MLEPTHLGITTGIVCDGSVSVGGEGDTECGEHADGRDTNAIEAEAEVCAVSRLAVSNPVAKRKARMMATAIVITGTAVEIIPMPRPEMMTVAGPDSAL